MTTAYDDVLDVNTRFYEAHERRNIHDMRAVWERSDRSVCVHPGWPILRTWPLIEESWQRIFDGPGRNQFIVTNVVARGNGDMVWVTLDENLVEGAATGTIAATNMFARTDEGWKMVLHHGSPVIG